MECVSRTTGRLQALLLALGYALCASIAGVGCAAHAAAYPEKPVRIIVPYPPAGPTDILARLVGEKLSTALGQPVLIDNRAGAGGVVGSEIAAKSPPDGHTLVWATSGSH